MLYIPFLIVFAATALCIGLSARIATQRLGMVAAAADILAAAVLVVLAVRTPLPVVQHFFRWEVPDALTIDLILRLDMSSLALALLVLVGGALALVFLALAVAPDLKGFGSFFGYALLVQAAALLALLCSGPLLWPFAWALLGLASFAAAWSSGTLRDGVDGSFSLVYSLSASLLLLIGLLLSGNQANGTIQGAGAAICVMLATALAAGLPPFRGALDNLLAGPAALGGLLTALGLPLVALTTLWRLIETSPDLQTSVLWRYGLAVYGLFSLAVCAAGALREQRFTALLGALLGAQSSVALVGLALLRFDDQAHSPTLLLSNIALATLAAALAVAGLERHGRGELYTQTDHEGSPLAPREAQMLGLIWGVAVASALGVPSLWGFWGYRQLIENALTSMPWVVPPLLFGLTLLAFALLLPLGGFVSAALGGSTPTETAPTSRTIWWAALPAVYLLLAGVLPRLAWPLAAAPSGLALGIAWTALLLAVGSVLLLRRLRLPAPHSDADVSPTILAAESLGESVALLAWFGRPSGLIAGAWQGLLALGEGIQFVMGLFERRYYLAGVLLALLSILLIMAQ